MKSVEKIYIELLKYRDFLYNLHTVSRIFLNHSQITLFVP